MKGWSRQYISGFSILYVFHWQKDLQNNCIHSATQLASHQFCSTNTIYIPNSTTGCDRSHLNYAIPLHRNISRRNKGVFHILTHLFERIPKHDLPPVNVSLGCCNEEMDRTVGKHWKEIIIKMMRNSLISV